MLSSNPGVKKQGEVGSPDLLGSSRANHQKSGSGSFTCSPRNCCGLIGDVRASFSVLLLHPWLMDTLQGCACGDNQNLTLRNPGAQENSSADSFPHIPTPLVGAKPGFCRDTHQLWRFIFSPQKWDPGWFSSATEGFLRSNPGRSRAVRPSCSRLTGITNPAEIMDHFKKLLLCLIHTEEGK